MIQGNSASLGLSGAGPFISPDLEEMPEMLAPVEVEIIENDEILASVAVEPFRLRLCKVTFAHAASHMSLAPSGLSLDPSASDIWSLVRWHCVQLEEIGRYLQGLVILDRDLSRLHGLFSPHLDDILVLLSPSFIGFFDGVWVLVDLWSHSVLPRSINTSSFFVTIRLCALVNANHFPMGFRLNFLHVRQCLRTVDVHEELEMRCPILSLL